MKFLLLLIGWITIHSVATAQEKLAVIKGAITDSASGETLDQASVSLLRQSDRAVLRQTLAGKNGFEFRRLVPGIYVLHITFIGYRPDTLRVSISDTDTLYNAGKIQLAKSTGNLMEVVVRSVIPPVIVKNDTLVYNTSAVTTQPNATIEDLIKKLPGLAVDKDGNITLHGQKIEKVYIDGKEFFLNDPKIATQNLTADIVDAIEVFDNQSDKARFTGVKDQNVNKALNIRLKKDKKKGLFGNVAVSAGTMKNYSGTGRVTYFKGDHWAFANLSSNYTNTLSGGKGMFRSNLSQALNYRTNINSKAQIIVNYNGSNSRNKAGQSYKRETFLGDSSLLQNRNSFNESRASSQGINMNITYTIDSLSSVIYAPVVSKSKSENTTMDSSFLNVDKITSSYRGNEGDTRNNILSDNIQVGNTLTYRRRSRKKGRTFYAVLSQGHQKQDQDGKLFSSVRLFEPNGTMIENKVVDQRYDQDSRGNNYGVSIAYTEPIRSNQLIDLGYTLSTSSNRSRKNAYNYNPATGNYDLPDTLTTNDFSNSSTQQTFNMGYNYLGKKAQYQVGLSLLYGFLENRSNDQKFTNIEQRLMNWAPRMAAFYQLAKQKNLRFQYNGNTTAPTTEMLQPIPDLSNPFLVRIGNPNLKQQFHHSLSADYNASNTKTFRNLSMRVNSNFTMNKIVQSSVLTASGIQEIKYVNVNGVYSIGSSVNYGFSFNKGKGGGGQVGTNFQYNRDINFVNGRQNIRQGFTWGPSVNLNYQAKEKFTAGLSAHANYNRSRYSIGDDLNTALFSHVYSANFTYNLPWRIYFSSDLNLQVYGAQGNLPGRTVAMLNASIYKTLWSNKAEIRFSGYDLLNRNTGFSQSTVDNYIETRESAVMQRYFTLRFRYNFRMKV